jgi:zinc transport system substrate-binding protein
VKRSCGLVLLLAVVACGRGGADRPARPQVAVSIFPVYDLVRRIAGDRSDVILVLPPGRSEHGYDPTPKQIAQLDDARLAITIGLDMDFWVDQIANAAGIPVFHVGDHVPTLPIEVTPVGEVHDLDERPGAPDPHVWMDPDRMANLTGELARQLAAIDPDGKPGYEQRAREVAASLHELDRQIASRSATWTKRTIVTFHGSMHYYARRYGLVIAAVIEPLAGKEPTAAYLMRVLAAIQRSGAVALFSEPQFDRAPAQIIALEAHLPLGELDPVGGIAGRDSYEALLSWNTDQLDKVLR